MCGIAATIRLRDSRLFGKLFDPLAHRGPDERGVVESQRVQMGMHRLAIVGAPGMTLPLRNQSGRLVLAFNGEIYNHAALRQALSDYPFQTQSDSEILFPLLARAGWAGLRRLRGMYAFVLADLESGDFIAARDPYGIKPLYYAQIEDGFALASELKSFAQLPCQPQFLPPGHLLTRHGVQRWYHWPTRSRSTQVTPLRPLLEQAVLSHLPPPDQPCGVFLSGGVDSSVVAAIAARHRPDLTAYSVVLPGSPDESPAAEMAAFLGVKHQVLRVDTATIQAALPAVVAALESYHPVMVRNAVPLYLLAQMAAKECKVVLGGDGSDELFAGYDYLARLSRRCWSMSMDYGFSNLHRTELQRVDRMTMAHGLELRVPFLDQSVAEWAINAPITDKIRLREGKWVNKWALRAAVSDLLPPSIQWRQKLPLVEGSGFAKLELAKTGHTPGKTRSKWPLENAEADAFFPLWQAAFPNATPDHEIWQDAGRYHRFKGNHGKALLELFRH
ncbi:MAG: asparagine synthase (glutamine-hydrolyzing) [Magnetococcales bacterium]|nr:asparagine synthase (glutamine-hydrolyzing) [Magnetococcales bacterium]MBF0116234.1 asparagine synthase (glutamine-hydrolyzing) [Magnetococcales bacterium]